MWEYLTDPFNWSGNEGIWARIVQHLWYTFAALGLSVVIALPIGLRIGHTRRGAFLAINLGNAARALPSLGLLMIAVLLTDQIGFLPVLIALVALGIPPILASTYAGLSGVDPATIDAARGMGMTGREILTKVEIPIGLPLIISGVRSATLQIVSTATIAALVSLGGLGRYVVDGLKLRDFPQMFTGALLVALLALLLDAVFALIGRITVSPGLKIG
ncbi:MULTISPECIES: ABC transporter permease [Kribbella]|jgi:osmoprotectant transport system permease protein|uniref:Osmoprotectant transport system permease protein n=1 Tax=Kribbella pratensis TaxID=2512112 RepID=A0ABY2FDA7_9ACTN|nr:MULTISPECIES: ABC transporter permease [Kribbella]TDW81143.1 osmoprotectant transport system permease protein [Kribbella sp. VKM Ac-2566]TDW89309.1 osmoprotectant transport system permease protein [Kribbella pratensis]